MLNLRRLAVAGMAAAMVALPSAALAADASSAPITVGGQTVSAGGCDYTVVSFTIDPATGQISFTGASIDCP
jgi:hypothetical protein